MAATTEQGGQNGQSGQNGQTEQTPLQSPPPQTAAGDDYDPHQYRELDRPTNNIESLIHLLKCSLGTGILAMPQAFANAGLITAIISTVVVGAIVSHCLAILIKSQYAVCKMQRVPFVTYTQTMRGALQSGPGFLRVLARPSAATVDVFLIVYQLGICCVYIVFIAGNLKKVVDPYKELSIEVHMLIILLPLVAFNLIPNLKMLAPFSALANVLIMVGLLIVIYYLVTGKKSEEPLDLWGSAATFPLFFGTVLFALTSVGVVVAIENNMKTPKSFGSTCGVLNVGMTIIVVLYVVMGALGYNYCVSECSDSITLDLPVSPLSSSVVSMFTVAIFISYGLHCYVPIEIVWRDYVKPRLEAKGMGKLRLWEYGVRVVLCLITFAVAAAIPRLGLFISLFGALCLSALGIIFPCTMELCCAWPDKLGPGRILMYKDIFLFVVGIVGLVAGTYVAMLGIIKSFM